MEKDICRDAIKGNILRSAVTEDKHNGVAVPTITIGVAELEDDIAGILYDDRTFSSNAVVGIQSDGQRQLLAYGTVGVHGEVEHASGDARWVKRSHFKGVVFKADIITRRGNTGNGIGGFVVSRVLECGHNREGLSRDKTTGVSYTIELKHGFTSGDNGSSFPSIAATYGGGVDGEAGSVSNALVNAVHEAANLNSGFGVKAFKRGSAVEDGQAFILTAQRPGGGATRCGSTNVLEGDAHG